jgi:ribonuclease E
VAPEVADYLNNRKRHELARLENEGDMSVLVVGSENAGPEHLAIKCEDDEGREVKFP